MDNSAIPRSVIQKYIIAWTALKNGGSDGAGPDAASAGAKSLKRMIEEKGERPLTARKRMLLDDIDLRTLEGEHVHNAAVVLHF